MPDDWESIQGLNPFDASDRNNLAPSGYTWIEAYIIRLVNALTERVKAERQKTTVVYTATC